MGYSHWDKVCGVKGVFVGAKGSEQNVAVATFAFYSNTAGAAQKGYFRAPFDGSVSGVTVSTASDGSARNCTITECSNGTAGKVILASHNTFITSFTTAGIDVAYTMQTVSASTACVAGALFEVDCPAVAEGTAQVIAVIATVSGLIA